MMSNECNKASITQKGEEASSNEDHFLRLPSELLICILERVADLSSLCQCSLVSKYFASAVFCVRTIYVAKPFKEPSLSTPGTGSSETLMTTTVKQFKGLKLVKFLKKFRDLKSIYVVNTYLENIPAFKAFAKVRVKRICEVSQFESIVILIPASVHTPVDGEPDLVNTNNWLEWLYFMVVFFKGHPSLQRVVAVTDTEKKVKLVMEAEHISGQGKLMHQHYIGYGAAVPELRLPSSGYVMSKVSLLIISQTEESKAKSVDEVLLSLNIKDEEKIFGEAIEEILKHHRDKINELTSLGN